MACQRSKRLLEHISLRQLWQHSEEEPAERMNDGFPLSRGTNQTMAAFLSETQNGSCSWQFVCSGPELEEPCKSLFPFAMDSASFFSKLQESSNSLVLHRYPESITPSGR
ncbi:hypothetical protein H6P81_018468 [Aristolochia fimbriata]|uniref:Uncharacterized protein n=1 Tax=Aristolochia fimbriata TaxID=158543 RepID=A0AAV7E349_ARIFI|nr:hypothetical protein H6P81_018468 [Aristolochia fimbriata]